MDFLGVVPQPLTDAAGIVTALTIIGGGVFWTSRAMLNAFDKRARAANEPLAEQLTGLNESLDKHRDYVGYHLGPNGDTKPIHTRLRDLEIAHDIEVTE